MGSLTARTRNKTANPGLERARTILPAVPLVSGPFDISINGSSIGATYIGWTPAEATIRITNQPQPDLNVVLRNRDPARGGQVIFRTAYAGADQATLPLTLPGNGSPVSFFVAGKYLSPSIEDQDGGISVTDTSPANTVLHQKSLMVRVRKNANKLTLSERERFIDAYMKLNAATAAYQVFVDSHNGPANVEIHRRSGFLPWHRAFMVAFERRLQEIDPSVAAHYWHYDQPSPNIFSPDFMGGTPNAAGRVTFSTTNKLRNWTIEGTTGVVRPPHFDTATSGARWRGSPTDLNPVLSETDTLNLGHNWSQFEDMEDDPHDMTHSAFVFGPITGQPTATRDPIFFLLHSNIDRLWAKWQFVEKRFDASNPATYTPFAPAARIGDFVDDTMWPWNGSTTPPRPSHAPGGPLPQLAHPSGPGPVPRVRDVIDYIGITQGSSNFFFYDDVPFG